MFRQLIIQCGKSDAEPTPNLRLKSAQILDADLINLEVDFNGANLHLTCAMRNTRQELTGHAE